MKPLPTGSGLCLLSSHSDCRLQCYNSATHARTRPAGRNSRERGEDAGNEDTKQNSYRRPSRPHLLGSLLHHDRHHATHLGRYIRKRQQVQHRIERIFKYSWILWASAVFVAFLTVKVAFHWQQSTACVLWLVVHVIIFLIA
ncbi:hypothetical protein B0J12DRAFT_667774 [Macrophomina phaseolina]|uniref:Uncharacterized protein n=1 Tax=Macrophomina phaseolina TaxID=35725 RepID=A0ABQ8G6L5_9PEZI|nr:hypothetical protein B0J12DRAFT_667774 [Macrophomina phaseolina]